MSTNHQEPIHDPIDLLDELDSITRAQDMLRHRMAALAARYRTLESVRDRFDHPAAADAPYSTEYGHLNAQFSVEYLDWASGYADSAVKTLGSARTRAARIREKSGQAQAEAPAIDRRRSR
ncbi:hypothetical protein [Nocardia sp. NPDC057272]|uniref:hypothetical protein n=1 Tax=Nocardia sp. NPDC057272 TaxID=3346079 RepID=UPI003643FC7B